MLNVTAIKATMSELGLSGAALAEACQVSKEAASNWLSGESFPRPSKLARIAEVLRLSVEQIIAPEEADQPEPVYAFRTKANRAVSGHAAAAAAQMGRHLQQLMPYIDQRSEFAPPQVRDPLIDRAHVRKVAERIRADIGLEPTAPITLDHILGLFHSFEAILVPVLWGLNKEKHENALSVYLPESKASFVAFNLGCKEDDFLYWLAHEYGHCLSLHTLQGDAGEEYAEMFAPALVFPDAAASRCLHLIRAEGTRSKGLERARELAEEYGISIVTILKGADAVAEMAGEKPTGLLTGPFWAAWNHGRASVPSVASRLFGTDAPSPEKYLQVADARFGTPVFRALAAFQREEGRNPSVVSKTLMVPLGDAIGLSYALWERGAP